MEITVSIIVPVYNAEAYIRRCVDSVIHQEYKDFELLLVDDGSKDASGAICDEYAQMDERVRVIHKDNTGVSDTRNLAIGEAKGKYLQFMDSDDWITPDATKLLVRAAEENHCDMVIADFYRVVGERVSRKGDIETGGVLTKEEFAEHMMENPADFYYGVLWNKLYRRELIEKYHLRMDSRISWCEDFMFNLEYIMHAEVFYALQAPIYYYVKRKGSLVSQSFSISQTIKMKLMVFEYYNNFYKQVFDEDDYEKKRAQVYRYLIDMASDGNVQPSILPGVHKLGEERSVLKAEAVDGEEFFMGLYRDRKLMERYLEVVALKYDLQIKDVILLEYLRRSPKVRSRKELADLTGFSARSVSMILQKLVIRELIKVTEVRSRKDENRDFEVNLLQASEEITKDIEVAESDFEQVRYAGFTQDEKTQYEMFCSRIKNNILDVLK